MPDSAGVASDLRENAIVTEVLPATNHGPAQWLLRPDVDCWDLVRYGPPGFAVYMRITLARDADRAGREGEEPAAGTRNSGGPDDDAGYGIRRDLGGLDESRPGP